MYTSLVKILLFGATGSVGNAALEACVAASIVEATVEEEFRGIDVCLFCLGISSTQVSKEDYRTISYSYPLAAAHMLKRHSPAAAFHYISGKGTSAQSRMEWARVKAQTEHDLIELIGADNWRPAFIDAKPSASLPKAYALFVPLGRILKPFPSLYIHGHDLARAMLQATRENLRGRIIENPEIRKLAARASF